MPDGKYSVDDILAEIRQKRAQQSPTPPVPGATAQPEKPVSRPETTSPRPIPVAQPKNIIRPVVSDLDDTENSSKTQSSAPQLNAYIPRTPESAPSFAAGQTPASAARTAFMEKQAAASTQTAVPTAVSPDFVSPEGHISGSAVERAEALLSDDEIANTPIRYAEVPPKQEEPLPDEPAIPEGAAEPTRSFEAVRPQRRPQSAQGSLASTFLSRLKKPHDEAPQPDVETIPQEAMVHAVEPPSTVEPTDPVATAPTQDFVPVKRRPKPKSQYAERYLVNTGDVDLEAPTKIAGGSPQLPGDGESTEEKYRFLQDQRQKKVKSFVLQGDDAPVQEQGELKPADTPAKEEPGHAFEYEKPSDAQPVRMYFRRLRSRLALRLWTTGICAFLIALFTLTGILNPADGNAALYVSLPMAVLLVSAAISYSVMGGGLLSLVKMRADGDSLTALSVLWCVAQCVVLLFVPNSVTEYSIQVYCLLPGMTLFFNALGKYLHLARVTQGFTQLVRPLDASLPKEEQKLYAAAVISRKLSSDFSQIAELDAPIAAIPVETDFLTDYIEIANTADPSDRVSRTLCPVVLLSSLGVFALSFLLNQASNAAVAVSVATASFSLCAPLSLILCSALPMWLFNRQAARNHAMVGGFGAVEEFEDVDTVVVDANDLFPAGSIVLHGIKTLGMDKIDDHILDAASIVCYAKSTLAPIFLQVIENKTSLLRPVDNVVVEDGMGLAGWVNGRRVLVGNRDLLQNHGIDVPSREYENRYLKERRDIVYLATSGEISAMFIISYSADPNVEEALARLLKTDLSILVRSTDPNITARKLAGIFTFPVNMIRLIPGKAYADYRKLTQKQSRMPAAIALDGSVPSLAASLSAVRSIKRSISLSTLLQTIGIIAGFLMVALYGLTRSTDMGWLSSPGLLLLWQGIWAVISLCVSFFRKV